MLNERVNNYITREQKKLKNMKVKVIPIVVGAQGTVSKRLRKETGGTGNYRNNCDHSDSSIVEIDKNIKKSLWDPKRLAVTPVKDHQQTLV